MFTYADVTAVDWVDSSVDQGGPPRLRSSLLAKASQLFYVFSSSCWLAEACSLCISRVTREGSLAQNLHTFLLKAIPKARPDPIDREIMELNIGRINYGSYFQSAV